MRQAVARLTPRWLIRLGEATAAADRAFERRVQGAVARLTPRWWIRLGAAGSAADLAMQRRVKAAVSGRTPRWWIRLRDVAAGYARRRDVSRAVLLLALLLAAVAYVRCMLLPYVGDCHAYWQAAHSSQIYLVDHPGGQVAGYLYSPVFLQLLWPILSLPWAVFYGIWTALTIVTFMWLARPWLALLMLPFVFVTFGLPVVGAVRHEFSNGNVFLLMALAIVAGFRRPWTHSLLLLTKVTPGITLLWFVVRREWHNLAVALIATAALVAISFAVAPQLWFDWIGLLSFGGSAPEPAFAYHVLPLYPRLVMAAVIIVVGAHYNARWVLPIAALIAMPYIWDTSLTILLGVPPLLRHDAWVDGRHEPIAMAATVPGAPAAQPSPA